jgi:hypothetical protein
VAAAVAGGEVAPTATTKDSTTTSNGSRSMARIGATTDPRAVGAPLTIPEEGEGGTSRVRGVAEAAACRTGRPRRRARRF